LRKITTTKKWGPPISNYQFVNYSYVKMYAFLFLVGFPINAIFSNISVPSPAVFFEIEHQANNKQLPALKWIIQEGEQTLSPTDLVNNQFKDATLLHLEDSPIFPIVAHKPYWFKMRLLSQADGPPQSLAFFRTGDCWPFEYTFKEVEVYFFNAHQLIASGLSGTGIPASKRDFPNKIKPSLIKLSSASNGTQDVWVKVMMAESCNLQVDMQLMNNSELNGPRQFTWFLGSHILIIGAAISLLIIVLFLFFWSRDPIYFWFMFFQTFIIVAMLNNNYQNEIFTTLFQENPRPPIILTSAFALAWMLALLQFGRLYINTKRNYPRIHTIMGITILFFFIEGIIGIISRVVTYEYAELYFSIRVIPALIFLFAMFFILIYFVFSKDKLARFYSIGTLIPFSAVIFRLIEMRIGTPGERDMSLYISAGLLVTMTLALAFRFKVLLEQKESALEDKFQAEIKNSEQLKQINAASNRFVPQTFLSFLGKNNILEAALGDYVEKQVSLFFADIRNYTSLSEAMTPKENFEFVIAFNKLMGPIIQKNQGFINQYLGDGMMAIFPQQTSLSLKAAIAMQKRLYQFNQTQSTKNKAPISMGIGIHNGPLIMGIIGDDKRMDAATISDSVNVASRIESLTKHFGALILLSEACYQKLENKEEFNVRYLGKVIVKGKKKAIGIYECFDADTTPQFNLKKRTLSFFRQGLAYYLNQNFKEASQIFESILEENPLDKPANFFYEKAKYYTIYPLEKDWSGVERMLEK